MFQEFLSESWPDEIPKLPRLYHTGYIHNGVLHTEFNLDVEFIDSRLVTEVIHLPIDIKIDGEPLDIKIGKLIYRGFVGKGNVIGIPYFDALFKFNPSKTEVIDFSVACPDADLYTGMKFLQLIMNYSKHRNNKIDVEISDSLIKSQRKIPFFNVLKLYILFDYINATEIFHTLDMLKQLSHNESDSLFINDTKNELYDKMLFGFTASQLCELCKQEVKLGNSKILLYMAVKMFQANKICLLVSENTNFIDQLILGPKAPDIVTTMYTRFKYKSFDVELHVIRDFRYIHDLYTLEELLKSDDVMIIDTIELDKCVNKVK